MQQDLDMEQSHSRFAPLQVVQKQKHEEYEHGEERELSEGGVVDQEFGRGCHLRAPF